MGASGRRPGPPASPARWWGSGPRGAIVVLQLLLVTGVLTFEEEIGPVSLAFLALAAWFILTGRIAARAGVVPGGTRLGVLAASYVGYPVWAFRIARTLEAAPAMLRRAERCLVDRVCPGLPEGHGCTRGSSCCTWWAGRVRGRPRRLDADRVPCPR